MCWGTRPAVVAATSNLFSFPPGAGSEGAELPRACDHRLRSRCKLSAPRPYNCSRRRAGYVDRNPIELIDSKPHIMNVQLDANSRRLGPMGRRQPTGRACNTLLRLRAHSGE
jgi:hypothetical protein